MEEKIIEYQWIKGDNQGIVEKVVSEEGDFIQFETGRRCNKNIINEYMIKLDMDNTPLQFENPISKPLKQVKPIEKPTIIKEQKAKSPIISLIEKTKTKKVKLNITLECELPNKAFIKVLQDSFEDDISLDLAEYVLISFENPEKYLLGRLKESIEKWYKTNRNVKKQSKKAAKA